MSGFPHIGHSPAIPNCVRYDDLSITECTKQCPTDTAEGASKVKQKPVIQRLKISIDTVKYGRPIGRRLISSTIIRSTGV